MSAFVCNGYFALYHYIQNASRPRYPYGLCGPFASQVEAGQALERIAAAFPTASLHLEEAGLDRDMRAVLEEDQAAARQRIAQLRG